MERRALGQMEILCGWDIARVDDSKPCDLGPWLAGLLVFVTERQVPDLAIPGTVLNRWHGVRHSQTRFDRRQDFSRVPF